MASPDTSHGISRVVRHKDFYLRGGDMTVMVENHLYRVHSYFFERESLYFRQRLDDANTSVSDERGTTDENAYTLEGVKSEDFSHFLWVFYNPKYSVYNAPLETWLQILRLADRWTFDNVKELSVRELEKIEMEPIDKIATYQDNKISRFYLIPAYIAIVKRDHPLTLDEGNKIGMETALRLAEGRERLRQQVSGRGIRSPTSGDFDDAAVEILVRDIFKFGSRSVPTPAPTAPASPPATSSVNGVNGAFHSSHTASPAASGDISRANDTQPPSRSSWSMLGNSSASTTNRNTNTPNGHSNTANATNGHTSTPNTTSNTNTTGTRPTNANTASGRAANATNSTPTNTTNSAKPGTFGSALHKLSFPITTFGQAKELQRGADAGKKVALMS